MKIGENLKNLRLSRGLTQEDVAKSIKVSLQTIFKYEQGIITNIPLTKIQAMAELFDVDPADIIGWTRSDSTDSLNILQTEKALRPKQRILFDRSKELTDAQTDIILNVVNAILKEKDNDDI